MDPVLPAPKRLPWQSLLSILFALLYGASPIDLITDIIPLIGWIDDGVVALLMFAFAIASFRKWAKAKKAVPANVPAKN